MPLLLALLLSLGPEIPLGNTALRPAVFNQTLLNVASNGRDFIALWSDDRNTPFPGSRHALYTGRVDAAGRALEPGGNLITASTFGGHVLWTGSSYLLVYMLESGHTFLQPLDDDGRPVGAPKQSELAAAPWKAATNGRNLLSLQYNGSIWLNSLDGPVLWKQLIGEPTDASEIAVLTNGDYRFAALTDRAILLIDLDGATGFITSKRTLATNVDHMGAFVRPDGSVFVAWTEGAVAKAAIVDRTAPVQIASDVDGAGVTVGWDGHELAVALAGSDQLRIVRVAADGRPLDGRPIVLSGGPTQNVHFAATGTDVLIAGDTFNGTDWDIVARGARGFDDVAASETHPIASSLELQQRPRVADGGLTLWVERDLLAQVPGTGAPHVIAPGQVRAGAGRGASTYLVAWIDHGSSSSEAKVVVKRVAFDGTPLDAEPTVIATAQDPYSGWGDAAAAVAFDGTNFLVVWPDIAGDLFAVRVAQDGRPIDAQPIALTNLGNHSSAAVSIRAVWSGTHFVVAWNDQLISNVLIAPAPPVPSRISVVRLTASGQVLDAKPSIVWQKLGNVDAVGLAASGDGLELVWSLDCVYHLPLHDDGTPAGAASTLACGKVRSADVAWDGSEYVFVWADADGVKGLRLDVDDAPFTVAAQASQPSIGASAGGAAIAYIRSADGVPRVVARTLTRAGVPPRRRPSH